MIYKVIGLMSGSSLDGLDIAYCIFENQGNDWKFKIVHADCIPYDRDWKTRLKTAGNLDGRSLWKLHTEYGRLLAGMARTFIASHPLAAEADFIASHGHTVFHFPDERFTVQIGDGAALAAGTGIPVVCDLRSSDIAIGGQGSPIVPVGDLLLFKEYDYLLNIGGIANLSIKDSGRIIASDICAANQVLDHYAATLGYDYDKDGALASSGQLSRPLLDKLSEISYYQRPFPKTLDNAFSREVVIPVMDSFDISLIDKLNTYCNHIAIELVRQLLAASDNSSSLATGQGPPATPLFIAGGGAFNKYLISCISAHSPLPVYIPPDEVVKYKEAMVMAFISVLRWRKEANVLSSVTGASRDTSGGAVYLP